MSEIARHTVEYFYAPANYFWRWTENGEVIEWHNGLTIAYRDEVTAILKGLEPEVIPPFGTILLTLAACQENWRPANGGTLAGLLRNIKEEASDPSDHYLEYYIHEAVRFMDIIHSLPLELRTGSIKVHLIQEVFKGSSSLLSGAISGVIVHEFESGRLDEAILLKQETVTREQFKNDLDLLKQALERFPTKDKLALKLRTGLSNLPPVQPAIEPPPIDLLAALFQDPKTKGIARLTQHLIAAFNIQMHSSGTSDQPFGGVSDITNRGNLDRLLLSELAQDDVLLTARLVNNEALYLRREEPPDHISRKRIILIDSTIRMWGLPRVFALSSALACLEKLKDSATVEAYSLAGDDFNKLDLSTKEGVIESLEILTPDLHCGEALHRFLKNTTDDADYIFISEIESIQSSEFQAIFQEAKELLNFAIAVNNQGELHFYEYIQGKRKLLNTSKFQLEEILFADEMNKFAGSDHLPAFLTTRPMPLYFPSAALKVSTHASFFDTTIGFIGVTDVNRVLFFPAKDRGAEELLHYIESGQYYFGLNANGSVLFILVTNNKSATVALYTISLEERTCDRRDFSSRIALAIEAVVFKENNFYVRSKSGVSVIDVSGHVADWKNSAALHDVFNKKQNILSDVNHLKRFINTGYSVLQRVKNVFINNSGILTIDNHHIKIMDNGFLRLWDNSKEGIHPKLTAQGPEISIIANNPKVKLYRMTWANGSEAIVDSRGFLHLRSADAVVPEITIVLIIGKPLAAWAADGKVCGSPYFHNNHGDSVLSVEDFYIKYIQRYIDKLH